jgi:hypothetical protein
LDQTLRRLHELYQEEGVRRMHLVAKWAPQLIYFVVLILGGWWIITFYYNTEIKPWQEMTK